MANPKSAAKNMVISVVSALIVGAVVLAANFSGIVATIAGFLTLALISAALFEAF